MRDRMLPVLRENIPAQQTSPAVQTGVTIAFAPEAIGEILARWDARVILPFDAVTLSGRPRPVNAFASHGGMKQRIRAQIYLVGFRQLICG